MEETIRKFKEHLNKMQAYGHAFGILNYDAETVMPKGASEHLGMTYAVLSEEMYKLTVSPELKGYVKEILEHRDEVDYITRREAEELLNQADAQRRAQVSARKLREAVVMAEVLGKPRALRPRGQGRYIG